MSDTQQATTEIQVWDLWVRLFHWSLVVCVLFLLISGTTGWQFFEWHRTIGEGVLALLLFRLCWSVFGSENARLHKLVSSPFKALSHLAALATGKTAPERGHNAAGGWAVLTMICLIAFQAVSGLFIADEEELIEGAFYGLLGGDVSERLLHLHHLNATILKWIVLLHVLMIAVYALRASQNLLKPMLTGRMKWPQDTPLPPAFFQKSIIGLAIALACLAGTGTALSWW